MSYQASTNKPLHSGLQSRQKILRPRSCSVLRVLVLRRHASLRPAFRERGPRQGSSPNSQRRLRARQRSLAVRNQSTASNQLRRGSISYPCEVSEMNEQTLKPCPFCGSATAPTLIMRSVSHHVECNYADGGCGARGPYKSFPQEALAAWNKRADQSKELDALRAFAQAVMDCWSDGWGIEGDDLQHIATEHGMLVPEIRNSPCADGCRCAEHVLPKEWTDGVVCYRKTALLTGSKQ